MVEPSIDGRPFSLCTSEELRNTVLTPCRHIVDFDTEGVPLALADEVATKYATILVNERES